MRSRAVLQRRMSAGRPRWRATPDRALDRDPARQLGVGVVAAAAARLPDPLVGLVPVVYQPLEVAGELQPAVVVEGQPVLVAEVDGVHQLAVDVELQLGCRAVADPHRRRAHVALQVRELLLGQVLTPVDAVHDRQRARLAAGRVAEAPLQPAHERAGLLGEPEPEQRVEREGGVADPRVAVVPVARAADLFRQAGGGGGHDRAGGRVREQFEGERRAMHHLAPAPAVARAAQPVPPERHGGVELGGDAGIGARRRRLAGLNAVERERGRLPGSELDARADVVAVDDLERAARREAEHQLTRAEERAVLGERDLVAARGRSRSAGRRRRRSASGHARRRPGGCCGGGAPPRRSAAGA